jgi:hypothetical protein
MRPTLLAFLAQNHRLPSAPDVMPIGMALVSGRGNSSKAPLSTSSRPIFRHRFGRTKGGDRDRECRYRVRFSAWESCDGGKPGSLRRRSFVSLSVSTWCNQNNCRRDLASVKWVSATGTSALCQKRTSRRARPVQCQPGLSGCIVVA